MSDTEAKTPAPSVRLHRRVLPRRTAVEFETAAREHGITRWTHHDCAICGYETAYHFEDDGSVWFDPGCYCGGGMWRPRDWQSVADHYNLQTSEDVRAEMDTFWHFA